jgi:hypothetical protein
MRLGPAVLATVVWSSAFSVTDVNAQVTSVQVTPSPAIVGQPATVTVTGGAAPCGAVEINFGDGAPTTYPISALPLVQAHTWTAVGTYAVVATGQGDCTGQASVSITVGKPNRATKAGVSPSKGIHIPMRIKSYFGLSQPGGAAAIAGHGFGPTRGTVVAKLKAWNGDARIVWLTVKGWSPTLIEVEWPASLIGVRDQTDAIVEARHDNAIDRTSWKVFFRADTEQRVLPMSRVKVVTCGKDGNFNTCNSTSHNGAYCTASWGIDPGILKCAGSFLGFHANCFGAVGNDQGTDEFEVRLRNGWTIASVDFQKKSEGGAVGNPAPSAPTGSAAWNPRVTWAVTPADEVSYCAFVHISGPKGVPF